MNRMRTNMAQTLVSERLAPWHDVVFGASGAGYSLNVVFLYQDSPTRKWTKELYERVTNLAGPHTARATWWRISDLREPGVLAGAVSTAMRADVVVVAVRADEGLSLPFYIWVNAWLPHRQPKTGALVALLDTAVENGQNVERLRGYLECVARQGSMDFLAEQRRLPIEQSALDLENSPRTRSRITESYTERAQLGTGMRATARKRTRAPMARRLAC